MMKGKPSTEISPDSCFVAGKDAERVGNKRGARYAARRGAICFGRATHFTASCARSALRAVAQVQRALQDYNLNVKKHNDRAERL